MATVTVTDESFKSDVLESDKPVLVDFWADWCAPCKALFPVLEKIVDSYQGELLLAKVNCDTEVGLTERFGIRSLPTVVLFKDGQPVEGFAGVQPETAIRELLAPHVAEPQPEEEAEPEADLATQAQALIDAGQPQEAIALLQPALQAETDDALLLLLARALLADGQLDDADKVINAVQQKDSHKQTLSALKAQLSWPEFLKMLSSARRKVEYEVLGEEASMSGSGIRSSGVSEVSATTRGSRRLLAKRLK